MPRRRRERGAALLALVARAHSQAIAWYQPGGKVGACRSASGGSGIFEEVWETSQTGCAHTCAKQAARDPPAEPLMR